MRTALVCVLVAGAACASTRVVDRAVDGTPILICGPQPDAESLQRLHRFHGVKTVVNLRGESRDETWFKREQRGVEAVGARWIHLKTNSQQAPPPELVDRFFEVVEDRANWPVFVHCQSGIHRTGLMCALYRMQYQGWTGEQALKEMKAHGFEWGRGDRSATKEYVRHYRPDPERKIER
ncbi:MAG: protein tyrosine phosphatase family protein [Planctomycetota bacterium]|jgi:protein tyrosine/serine phosphatase